ncbi:SGNH/GDSL hydrolase family protein [Okibacterium endophyticum]
MNAQTCTRYVATGDSITEGLGDPQRAGTHDSWLGWADRFAMMLADVARSRGSILEYANVAVRSRRIAHVVNEQIPEALALKPDLVSIMVGANDLAKPGADPDALAAVLEEGVVMLRKVGSTVLLANSFDPFFMPVLRPLRGRAAIFNSNVWSIARTHGAHVLDLWGTRELQRSDMRCVDRVHLSPEGHALVARLAAQALGVIPDDGSTAMTGARPVGQSLPLSEWVSDHVFPWVIRRVRGKTAGDGRTAKRPALQPLVLPQPSSSDVTATIVG